MYCKQTPLLEPDQEQIVAEVLDCGFAVHRVLGPGFREGVYHRAYGLELDLRGLKYEAEKPISVPTRTGIFLVSE
jgi:GxxExxY protein